MRPDLTKPFEIGLFGNQRHAIPTAYIGKSPDSGSYRPGLCGLLCTPIANWGRWTFYNEHVKRREACPTCAWTYTLLTGQLGAMLRSLHPAAAHLCRAILDREIHEDNFDPEHPSPRLIERLTYATEHAPWPLQDEACREGACDHARDDCPDCIAGECEHAGECPEWLSCRACSLLIGQWSGEREGDPDPDFEVTGPCDRFKAIETYYGIYGPSPGGESAAQQPRGHAAATQGTTN